MKGIIFDTGFNTGQDGPGLRSIIYLKGCNFRCLWCANPESWHPDRELLLYPEKEQYIERILKSCPLKAIRKDKDKTATDRNLCRNCDNFICTNECFDNSRVLCGRIISSDEIIEYAKRYKKFWSSGGGVTLTGGEPTFQFDFLRDLLYKFKKEGINTAVETNGSHKNLEGLIDLIDLIICDIKHIDADKHKQFVDSGNEQILENIITISNKNKPLWIRLPIIPGYTDSKENITGIMKFLRPIRNKIKIEFIKYHQLGIPKWKALGKEYSLKAVQQPDSKKMSELKQNFLDNYFKVIST